MLKIFAWIVSNDLRFLDGAIKILERQHGGIELVGSAVNEDLTKVDREGADLLLVIGAKQIGMNKILQAARQLNLPEEKFLGDWIACLPGFTLEKYRRLQRSRLSIFAMNCFGGVISHTLGLPFLSPFVNMFLGAEDFLRFLREPRSHLDEKLTLLETKWQTELKFYYPVVEMRDAKIYMNHYPDFDEAVAIWERRKARINWYNLFVTMYTEREDILQEFDKLPYGKKVCFVPFKSDLDSAWYIKPNEKFLLWQLVNGFAWGQFPYYDVFDMLLYGKKTQLIDM